MAEAERTMSITKDQVSEPATNLYGNAKPKLRI